jgi:phospholipase/carboxylesterase
MTAAPSFVHKFVPGSNPPPPPVLLLHGTGGDENDLLPFGRVIAPGSALIALRGNVLENGMPRFFRRIREGVFDEADVRRRAHELADFVDELCRSHELAVPVAVGFSNGANIAAAVLLLRPETLDGAVLMRAVPPLKKPPASNLSGKPILIISGAQDTIAAPDKSARLAATLTAAGADVDHETISAGHGMIERDMLLAAAYFDGLRRRQIPAEPL